MVDATYRIPIENPKIDLVITGSAKILSYQPLQHCGSSVTLLKNFLINLFTDIDLSSSQLAFIELLYSSIPGVLMCPYGSSVKITTCPAFNLMDSRAPISQLQQLYISVE